MFAVFFVMILSVSVASVSDVLSKSLVLKPGSANEVINAGIDRVFDANSFFGFFAIIPALKRADEVARDTAEAFKFLTVKIIAVLVEILLGFLFITEFGN